MNTEDFVTYEQAVALKKLGFDWEVNHYYSNEQLEELITGSTSDYDNCNSTDYIDSICSASTLAQVQKWLNRTKDLKLFVVPSNSNKVPYSYVVFNTTKTIYKNPPKYYSSYEEALSEGITECIKILEK